LNRINFKTMAEKITTNQTQQTEKPGKKSKSKILLLIIILLIILIAALLIWILPQQSKLKKLAEEKETQRVELVNELGSLMSQHDSVKVAYGALSDSLFMKDSIIQSNAKEIKQLLNYKWEYRKVNKKLELLRKITRGYVHQIDSLFTVNKVLKEENERITQKYETEQQKANQLTKDKDELIEKVSNAAHLKAYNIIAQGIRLTGSGREKVTNKAAKIEQVKICYTLGVNDLVEEGTKKLYLRIARPDNVIVTQKVGDIYTFEHNGEKIQYTTKKEVNYQKEAINVCMYWKKRNTKEAAMIGKYNISLFADGYEIGQTFFELK